MRCYPLDRIVRVLGSGRVLAIGFSLIPFVTETLTRDSDLPKATQVGSDLSRTYLQGLSTSNVTCFLPLQIGGFSGHYSQIPADCFLLPPFHNSAFISKCCTRYMVCRDTAILLLCGTETGQTGSQELVERPSQGRIECGLLDLLISPLWVQLCPLLFSPGSFRLSSSDSLTSHCPLEREREQGGK